MFIHEHDITIGLLIVIVMAFIMLGHIYQEAIQQPLKTPLMRICGQTLDYWSVSHFFFYLIIGYLCPDHFIFWAIIGTGFELTEDLLAADHNTQLVNCKDCKTKGKETYAQKIWCNGIQDDFWYSAPSDPFVNMIGYACGELLRTGRFRPWKF
jgi:hypothetical protein